MSHLGRPTLEPHPQAMGGGRLLRLGLEISLGQGLCDRQIQGTQIQCPDFEAPPPPTGREEDPRDLKPTWGCTIIANFKSLSLVVCKLWYFKNWKKNKILTSLDPP